MIGAVCGKQEQTENDNNGNEIISSENIGCCSKISCSCDILIIIIERLKKEGSTNQISFCFAPKK